MGKLNMDCSLWLCMADTGAPDANEANGFETVAEVPATARGKAEEAANDVATGASVRSEGKLGPMEEGLLKMEFSLRLCMADTGAPDANEENGFKGAVGWQAGALSKLESQEEENMILEGFTLSFSLAMFTFGAACAGRGNPGLLVPLLASKAATLPKPSGPIA